MLGGAPVIGVANGGVAACMDAGGASWYTTEPVALCCAYAPDVERIIAELREPMDWGVVA